MCIRDSNGTAMRTAALGLWFGDDRKSLVQTTADISQLTHQDPRGIAGGVAIALATNVLASDREVSAASLCDTLADSISGINTELAGLIGELPNRTQAADCR